MKKGFYLSLIAIVIIFVVIIYHIIPSSISIFSEEDIKEGYYIIITESDCGTRLERVISDNKEIQELASLLSDLEYRKKKRIDPAGGYSITISLFDERNMIKTATILCEKKTVICLDKSMYYLKSDQLNVDKLKRFLSEDN